jgi:16S rRNA (adenine1518-N6/adenine1519-N6)-dimethyltransferase
MPMPKTPPRKRFGQHFLEPAWVAKLIRVIAPAASDVFLEIGPGRGALTRPLAAAVGRVVGVEIDRDLAAALRATAPDNLSILEGDFLEIPPDRLRAELGVQGDSGFTVRVAANLPYNVAAPILFRLVEFVDEGIPFADATVMLQREVAERLLASPGTRDYSVLTVMMRRRARVERLLELPPGAFRPAPKVSSTVVRLSYQPPSPAVRDPSVFDALTRAIFTRRRKTLANALRAYVDTHPRAIDRILADARVDGTRRPDSLTLEELGRLADAV